MSEKLDATDFTSTIKLLNENLYVPREAGSQKDENLALYIENQFREFKLSKVWRDQHFVKIQVKDSAQNSVIIVDKNGGLVYLVENPGVMWHIVRLQQSLVNWSMLILVLKRL